MGHADGNLTPAIRDHGTLASHIINSSQDMLLQFTKGSGKYDHMQVFRDGTASECIECPKQGIIPHDMVHFAVEGTLQRRGFLSRVRDGEAASLQMIAEAESDGIERLVEVIQGDAWSGGSSTPTEMLEMYQVTCRARQCNSLPVTSEDIEDIRGRIRALDQQWKAVAIGQVLDLEF